MSEQRTSVLAVRTLNYGDVEVVQGRSSVLRRIELRESVREPLEQFGGRYAQSVAVGHVQLCADNVHGQRVDVATHHVRAQTRSLNQRGATAREGDPVPVDQRADVPRS